MGDALAQMASVGAGIVLEAGFWIVISLLVGGLIHEFLPTARLQSKHIQCTQD